MKRLLLIILLIFPLSCYDGLSDMLGDVTMKVPICVDAAAAPGGDGRGWRNAYTTLADAVAAAEDGDEIWVAGSQNITATVTIDKSLSLYGGFSGTESRRQHRDVQNKTDIVGQFNVNITISSVNGVVIDGFKFSGFSNLGVLLINSNSSVTVKSCLFVENWMSGSGGAIDILNSEMTISNTVFEGNSALNNGGAINVNSSIVNISSSRFGDKDAGSTGNSAKSGGAIFAFDGSTVTISNNCEFYRNSSTASDGGGGAIYINNTTLNISRSKFGDEMVANSGNTTAYHGGAIYASAVSTVIIDKVNFYRNSSTASDGGGGAVHAYSISLLKITGSIFGSETAGSGNSALYGGAVSLNGSAQGEIESSDFINNFGNEAGSSSGGAIRITDGSNLKISSNSRFLNNRAKSGGAIRVENAAQLEVTDSSFKENQSTSGNGGAVLQSAGSSVFSGNNFSGNITSASGGAIYVNSGGTTISACRFNSNSAAISGGALFYNQTTAATVVNSYFYNNSAYNGGALYISGHDLHALINLTFYLNSAANNGGAIYSLNNSIVYNNVFYGNTATLQGANIWANNYFTMRYCYFYQGIYSLSSSGPGNFTLVGVKINSGNPFASISPDASNFLYPSTALGEDGLINNGTVDFSAILPFTMPATDLAGNMRIRGGAIDIGAYERQ